MNLPVLVGDRIKALRKAKGWTQEQLAEFASLHYSYIGGVERGDRNIPLETLEKIIAAFQVPPMELFRIELQADELSQARRAAIDEHLTMISNRTLKEIETLNKINKDILAAIDLK
ncbi:helix-turn-helix transcriptional regulator [Paenibacillus frigoriresistens]|uniref:helix-turn-helix domain-containing protein n=1 Tax=Paenibacillus alginolyticus TaxID=59839 RepID=UPI0015636DEB|nr:helix-turn-helix transcriptional regulator [Paenibacillus frigoriresistens]NRF96182.1 helix-turn-helix transcriptional regulator [Paenibacillus frigoriresistens]